MSTLDRLEAALRVVLDEARTNDDFRARLEAALSGASGGEKRRNRRAQAPVDPFSVFETEGEVGLRRALGALDLEQLKDVIAGYDMDRDRLALRWRSPERLIARIVEVVASRRRKGDAFLGDRAGEGKSGH